MTNKSNLSQRQSSPLWSVLVMLVCVVGVSGSADAQTKSVGSLVRVVDESTITNHKGEVRDAKRRSAIYPGDVITTGEEGWVTINFFDLTRVVLRPDTVFGINKFPKTMNSGHVELEFIQGGARITAGTIASNDKDRFTVISPTGKFDGEQGEWVMRSCEGTNCTDLQTSFEKCAKYLNPLLEGRQVVSAYKGEITVDYCSDKITLKTGTSLLFDEDEDEDEEICQVIGEVPCFILYDDKLGRDKLRTFLPSLTEDPDAVRPERPERPDSRNVPPRRPRIDRPRRP